jgi:hypothetical protein
MGPPLRRGERSDYYFHSPSAGGEPSGRSLTGRSQSQSYVTIDNQTASLSWYQAPIWGPRPGFYYCHTVAGLLMWGALCHEKTGLPFIIAAGPRQRSHPRVRAARDLRPYFTASDSRLPQPGGPGSRIYIPQEQCGQVIPLGTGFRFRRFLRLAGLLWRYSNPPPRGVHSRMLLRLIFKN